MKTQNDNLPHAAILTPPAPAGIAVIQVRADHPQTLIQQIFQPARHTDLTSLDPNRPRLGRFIDPNTHEPLDQVLLILKPERNAFEIQCHGGPRIVQRIMMALESLNVRITDWQNLTTPASLIDEITFTLPNAQTPLAVTALAAQHPAGLNRWLTDNINLLKNNHGQLKIVQQQIEPLLNTKPLADRLLAPSAVVLTGPANAGKSTLANTLTGRFQSIIDHRPGATRDWTEHLIDINGLPVRIIDTAGRKQPQSPIEQKALEFADRQILAADLILLVVESQPNLNRAVQSALADLKMSSPSLIVINKIDAFPPQNLDPAFTLVSALNASNFKSLTAAIAGRLGFEHFDPHAPLIFTTRQHDLLSAACLTNSTQHLISLFQTIIAQT